MQTGIYAVLDLVAQTLIGGLMLHKHPAAAVRMFTDALSDQQTILAKHPHDFDLVLLGYLTDDGQIQLSDAYDDLGAIPRQTILSGKQWLLSQEKPDTTQQELQLPRSIRQAR